MHRLVLRALLAAALLATTNCGEKPDVYNVSIPAIKASPDESIVSLDIRVNAGTVQCVSNIPVGWQVRVENDAGWTSHIKANSTVGSASLAADELKRIVFNIRRNESETFKFNLKGTASISKTFDNRQLDLKMEDFALTPGQ